MAKLPAFQFYPGDWRKDPGVQSLSYHDRGVWFELICLMHESETRGKLILNGKPMPNDAICRLLGLDNQILTTTLTTLLTYGVTSICETTGAIMSRRMVRDEEIRQVRKLCGKLGGNPNLVNQNSTTGVKVETTPSSSSSSSSSIQEKKEEKNKIKNKSEKKIFNPPSISDLTAFANVHGYNLDCDAFLDYWLQRNWTLKGGQKMADWKAAVRTWERNNLNYAKKDGNNGQAKQYKSSGEKSLDNLKAIFESTGYNKNPNNVFLSGIDASHTITRGD